MLTAFIIWLIGVYVLNVLFSLDDHSKLRNRKMERKDNPVKAVLSVLSWAGVLAFLFSIICESLPRPKWDSRALWPGNWFVTDKYVTLPYDPLTWAVLASLSCLIAIGFWPLLMTAGMVALIAAVVLSVMATSPQEDCKPIFPREASKVIVALMWLLGMLMPYIGHSQSYRDYYVDPANIQCAQVEICNDTTLEALCFDEVTFSELETVYADWCGPYFTTLTDEIYFPLTGKVITYQEAHDVIVPPTFLGNPELIKLLQSSPPINLKIKNVGVMVEPSEAPILKIYFGTGSVYTLIIGERAFDGGAGNYPKQVLGVTVEDVLKALNDTFQPYE